MIELRNVMFQPLALQLVGDAKSLHLGPRQRRRVAEESVSEEMHLAESRGFITIQAIESTSEEQVAATTETPDQTVQQPDSLPESLDAMSVEPTLAPTDSEAQTVLAETTDAEAATRKRR